MTNWFASYFSRKGQMKIQQMAFVLVALMIFFSLVLLFYFMIRTSNLEEGALVLRGEEAQELVRSLAGAGEFAWSATDCAGCIDLDKTLIVKDRQAYQGFWKLDFLQFEVLGAETDRECSKFNYPDCSKISVLGEEKGFGDVVSSYVALCRYENEKGGYTRCDLGRIHVSGKGINNNA